MNSARNIFQNPDHFEEFEERGYLVLSLFSGEELESFERTFNRYFPATPPAFFSSSYLSDFNLKKEISKSIEDLVQPKLNQYFKDYRLQGAAFLSKAPEPYSELPLHQDWSTVDETQFLTANVWTPLTEITQENGALEVLPGSHKFFQALRAPTLPFSGKNLSDQLRKHLVPLFPKPGEVVLINHALVHYSTANRSNAKRLAFTAGLISKEAPLHFHYWNQETSELETFRMEDDFHFMWSNFYEEMKHRPRFGEAIGKRHYVPELYTEEWLNQTSLCNR